LSSDRGGRVLRGKAGQVATAARLDLELRRSSSGPGATVVTGRDEVERWVEQAATVAAAGLRDAARAEGYAQGYAEGRRAADEELRAQAAALAAEHEAVTAQRAAAFSQALMAVHQSATALERRTTQSAEDIESELATLAFGLVETLLGRELELAGTPGLDAVRRALALAPAQRPVTLRLNPGDHASLADLPDGQIPRSVTLVPDPTVAPGDCMAESDAVRIDASLGGALARVREVLTKATSGADGGGV
jgi:flagellar assembly protein FliH